MPSSRVQNSDEPRGLPRIFWAVFSGVLFGWIFSKLKTPIQESVETTHPLNSTDRGCAETGPQSPLSVTIQSYPPPSLSEEDKAEKKREKFFKQGSLAASTVTAVITLGILFVTWRYTRYAGGQLETMKGQLQIMQTQVELQERPWIKIVDVKPRGDFPIVGGLSFQKIGPFKDNPDIRVQATIQIELSFNNIGRSVADVTPNVELFMPPFSSTEYWNRISTEEQRFCGSHDMSAVTAQKLTVFPSELQPFAWYAGISTPVRPGSINHLPEGSGMVPALIVCVSYRHKGLPSLYQTRAVYEISHLDTHSRFFDIGDCDLTPFRNSPMTWCKGGIPAKLLKFDRNNMGDDAY